MTYRVICVSLLLVNSAAATTPSQAVAAAYLDAARYRPKEHRAYIRYLYFPQGSDILAWQKTADFWMNNLSSKSRFSWAHPVRPGLLRIDLLRLGIDLATWERLAEADPYFHIPTKAQSEILVEQVWPGGKDSNGKFFKKGIYTVKKKAGQTYSSHDPAPDATTVKYFRYLVHSEVPIVRGDWFIDQTCQQEGSKVGYLDFLGVKSRNDFFTLVGFNRKLAEQQEREIHAVVRRSAVTLKPRQLRRYGTVAGGLWVSLDTSLGTGRANPLVFLNGRYQHEAEEYFATKKNGLLAVFLSNKAGILQKTAPPNIASDSTSPDTDRQVHVGRSCFRCHVEGIRPINDWARSVYQVDPRKGGIGLGTNDPKELLRLEQLYLSNLNRWVKRDQDDYAEALWELVQIKPLEMSRMFSRQVDTYRYKDINLAQYAQEAGYGREHAKAALRRVLETAPPLHPILAGLIAESEQPVRREHVEETYSLFLAYMRGYIPPKTR